MKKTKSPKVETPVTEFDVDSLGTLSLSGFAELETRAEFYEDVAGYGQSSPQDLLAAMEACQPLAWAVHSIYSNVRDEIQSDLNEIATYLGTQKKRAHALEARLKAMPEEPEEGVEAWLLSLTTSEFEAGVAPVIAKWFNDAPNWGWEDDYLPAVGTAQGAAMKFFKVMPFDDLDAIGVVIVEGEHPGSTYYAAELEMDVEAANQAAANKGILVRFKRGKA